MKDYKVTVEYKCGSKRSYRERPPIIHFKIEDENGNIITRCVYKGFWKNSHNKKVHGYLYWKAVTWGPQHEYDLLQKMDNDDAYELIEKMWKTNISDSFIISV